jgi:hypothetical protein
LLWPHCSRCCSAAAGHQAEVDGGGGVTFALSAASGEFTPSDGEVGFLGWATDMTETWRLFRKYYGSAGVSMHWLKRITPVIKGADLWQTGGDLIDAKTGIIMHALGDTIERATAFAAVEPEQASNREAVVKEPRGRSHKLRSRRL